MGHEYENIFLVIVLSVISLPTALFCFLVNRILGLICLVGAVVVAAVIYFLGMGLSRLFRKADCAVTFANFESDRIIRYFKEQEG